MEQAIYLFVFLCYLEPTEINVDASQNIEISSDTRSIPAYSLTKNIDRKDSKQISNESRQAGQLNFDLYFY